MGASPMKRSAIDNWVRWVRPHIGKATVLCIVGCAALLVLRVPPPWAIGCLLASLSFLYLPILFRVLALARYAEGEWFEKDNVRLICPIGLVDHLDTDACLQAAVDAWKEIGVLLHGNPDGTLIRIVVIPTSDELTRLLGQETGGMALIDYVLIGADFLTTPTRTRESLRHEIAHLQSKPFGRRKPSFIEEGLAVWLQGSDYGRPIHAPPIARIQLGNIPRLKTIGRARVFDSNPHDSYAAAGSFTGFLIDYFGWRTYLEFYRCVTPRWTGPFQKVFGLTPEQAEKLWHEYLSSLEGELEPHVTVLAAERRVLETCDRGRWKECLAEGAKARSQATVTSRMLWSFSSAAANVGDLTTAAEALEQAIALGDDWVVPYLSEGWLSLGQLYEGLGRRKEAIGAYRKALELPDYLGSSSTHQEARRHLELLGARGEPAVRRSIPSSQAEVEAASGGESGRRPGSEE